jgi:hypothetical protein
MKMPQMPVSSPTGVQGSTGTLPLVDLLQVWGLNRSSGLVTIVSQGRTAHVYLVDGEVVHADAEGRIGEAALRTILGWPDGAFELAPNTTTLERTIQKSLSHLLLDAHREIDEARRAAPPSPARAAPPTTTKASVLEQIRAIREVVGVVQFGADGRPLGGSAAGDEALAAKALYVSMVHSGAVAASFGLKELKVAALDSPRGPFVLLQGGGTSLCIALLPGTAVDPVVRQLRTLLARPAAR